MKNPEQIVDQSIKKTKIFIQQCDANIKALKNENEDFTREKLRIEGEIMRNIKDINDNEMRIKEYQELLAILESNLEQIDLQ